MVCALTVLPGCHGGSHVETRLSSTLVFTERNVVPLNVPDGSTMSVTLENFGTETVTLVSVEPVTDPGLEATYIGWSTCRRAGCGTFNWDEHGREVVSSGVEGATPIVLHPRSDSLDPDGGYLEAPRSLIFRMRPRPDDIAANSIEAGCMKIQAVLAHLSSGRTVRLEFATGGYIGGLVRPEPTPSGYAGCGNPPPTRSP